VSRFNSVEHVMCVIALFFASAVSVQSNPHHFVKTNLLREMMFHQAETSGSSCSVHRIDTSTTVEVGTPRSNSVEKWKSVKVLFHGFKDLSTQRGRHITSTSTKFFL
jgi:hypothetical protein